MGPLYTPVVRNLLIVAKLLVCLLVPCISVVAENSCNATNPYLFQVSQVTVGDGYRCALFDSNFVRCWGLNEVGQLGAGNSVEYEPSGNIPMVDLPSIPLHIVAGNYHTCTLLSEVVACWGSNIHGQVGLAFDTPFGVSPHILETYTQGGFASVEVAEGVTCAVSKRGKVYCWGRLIVGYFSLSDGQEVFDYLFDGTFHAFGPPVDFGSPNATTTQVACGLGHICALFSTGEVTCIGHDSFGLLGYGRDNSQGTSFFPTEPAYLNFGTNQLVTQIAAGDHHTCALLASKQVKCWGSNNKGQLGFGLFQVWGNDMNHVGDQWPAVDLGEGRTAKSITANRDATCAILDDNGVKCWGAALDFISTMVNDRFANIGDGFPYIIEPSPDPPLSISVTSTEFCATLSNKRLICSTHFTYQPNVPISLQYNDVDIGSDRFASSVATGNSFACIKADNNRVKCYGENGVGQLGLQDTISRGRGELDLGDALPFVDLGHEQYVLQVSTGYTHACAVLVSGKVKCWGDGTQLGYEDARDRGSLPGTMGDNLEAVNLGTDVTATQVACGDNMTCVLTNTKRVKCWGMYQNRRIVGTQPGDMGDNLPYMELDGPAESIATGQSKACAIVPSVESRLQCWGRWGFNVNTTNESGTDPSVQTVNLGGAKVVQISVGGNHVCVVVETGDVQCFGYEAIHTGAASGYLGYPVELLSEFQLGFVTDVPAGAMGSVDIGTGLKAKQVAVGYAQSCVILTDGRVKCWGSNQNGALGLPKGYQTYYGSTYDTLGDNLPFAELGYGRTALSISATSESTCAVLDNLRVKCWGANIVGNLGGPQGVNDGALGNSLPYVTLGTDPHCFPGSQSDVGFTCSKCVAGTFQAQASQASCLSCGRGEFSDTGASVCSKCPPGTRQDVAGQSSCDVCPFGQYQPLSHSTSCVQCPDKTTTTFRAATHRSHCVATTGNFMSSNGDIVTCFPWANCTSSGISLETLPLKSGYWRETNITQDAKTCINSIRCPGGDIGEFAASVRDSTKYCKSGHRGPFCKTCKEGFGMQAGICVECSATEYQDSRRKLNTLIGVALGVCFVVGIATATHDVFVRFSPKSNKAANTFERPKQALKIVLFGVKLFKQQVALFQVLSAYLLVFGSRALARQSVVDLLILDPNFFAPLFVATTPCYNLNHNELLLLATLIPLGCCAAFVIPPGLVMISGCLPSHKREKTAQLALGCVVGVMMLVTPGVLRLIFDTFGCDSFNDYANSRLLRIDPTLECSEAYYWYAVGMAIVYGFGVLVLFAIVLHYGAPGTRLRKLIPDSLFGRTDSNEEKQVKLVGKWKYGALALREGYKPEFRWFELAEHVRKLIQGPLVVFFFDGEMVQIVLCLLLSFIAVTWLVMVRPFPDWRLTSIAILAQFQLASFCGLCIHALSIAPDARDTDVSPLDNWVTVVVWIGPAMSIVCLIWAAFEIWNTDHEAGEVEEDSLAEEETGYRQDLESTVFEAGKLNDVTDTGTENVKVTLGVEPDEVPESRHVAVI